MSIFTREDILSIYQKSCSESEFQKLDSYPTTYAINASLQLFPWEKVLAMRVLLDIIGLLFVSTVFLAETVQSWHPYDQEKKHSIDEAICESFAAQGAFSTAPLPPIALQKWKLWPNLMNLNTLGTQEGMGGETMMGLEMILDAIWKNQHPEDCSTAKFLISEGFHAGFGSELHVEGTALVAAMNLGRVYINLTHKRHNTFFVENDFCRAQNQTNLQCYYEPWTSCSMQDALGELHMSDLKAMGHRHPINDLLTMPIEQDTHTVIAVLIGIGVGTPAQLAVPNIARSFLECSPIRPDFYPYWWRAASITYLMRPNPAVLEYFQQHRSDPTLQFDPEQERCISIKIRKGDKHMEMELIEDVTEFFLAAQEVWDRLKLTDAVAASQPRPVMFVESEDPDAMDSAKQWAQEHDWRMMYADLYDRRTEASNWMDFNTMINALENGTFVHNPNEYLLLLLTIDYHTRCSGFVCTHHSNGCRLIDELRATVGGKADVEYIDMHPCHPERGDGSPPCYETKIKDLGWRKR